MIKSKLTGNYCHKCTFWGNLVLWIQVEETSTNSIQYYNSYWRKAKFYELTQLNLK